MSSQLSGRLKAVEAGVDGLVVEGGEGGASKALLHVNDGVITAHS